MGFDSLEDFVADGRTWSIDLKSHWVRAVEMSRINLWDRM